MSKKIGWFELNMTDKQRPCPAFLIFWLPEGTPKSERLAGDCYWPDVSVELQEEDGETFPAELRVTMPHVPEYNDLAVKLLGLLNGSEFTTPTQMALALSEFLQDGMPSHLKE